VEAEESQLLQAIARELLVKTQQTGKGIAGAVVICEVWRSVILLSLLIVPSGVCRWSIRTPSISCLFQLFCVPYSPLLKGKYSSSECLRTLSLLFLIEQMNIFGLLYYY
jgi:hypothetical protein